VKQTVNSDHAVVFGMSEGGNMALLFAATYPERTIALITFGVYAKRVYDPEYPWAPTPEQRLSRILSALVRAIRSRAPVASAGLNSQKIETRPIRVGGPRIYKVGVSGSSLLVPTKLISLYSRFGYGRKPPSRVANLPLIARAPRHIRPNPRLIRRKLWG